MGRPRKNPLVSTETTTDPEEEPVGSPIEVADIEDAELAATQPEVAANGIKFWFGEKGVLKFPDGTQYHIRTNHALIVEPKLIENLKTASKNPSNKIFIQD